LFLPKKDDKKDEEKKPYLQKRASMSREESRAQASNIPLPTKARLLPSVSAASSLPSTSSATGANKLNPPADRKNRDRFREVDGDSAATALLTPPTSINLPLSPSSPRVVTNNASTSHGNANHSKVNLRSLKDLGDCAAELLLQAEPCRLSC